jgi:hypothetical protein
VSLGHSIRTNLKDDQLSGVRFCNTMQMMFHEYFWAAIATAAPVIALANTVSITDVVNVWLDAKARPRSFISRFYYFVVVFCSALNLILQVIALLIALLCLLSKRDLASPVAAIVFVILGLVYVLITVLISAVLKYKLGQEREMPNRKARNG